MGRQLLVGGFSDGVGNAVHGAFYGNSAGLRIDPACANRPAYFYLFGVGYGFSLCVIDRFPEGIGVCA